MLIGAQTGLCCQSCSYSRETKAPVVTKITPISVDFWPDAQWHVSDLQAEAASRRVRMSSQSFTSVEVKDPLEIEMESLLILLFSLICRSDMKWRCRRKLDFSLPQNVCWFDARSRSLCWLLFCQERTGHGDSAAFYCSHNNSVCTKS